MAQPAAESTTPAAPDTSGVWALPLMCLGVTVVACCVIIPAADANRPLVDQHRQLQADLAQIDRQIEAGRQFVEKMHTDPATAERLARLQMGLSRPGATVLEDGASNSPFAESPFALVNVEPPKPVEPTPLPKDKLSRLVRDTRTRLYVMVGGLACCAISMLGGLGRKA